ncbi:MAG: HAMP domain-containing protein [Rhodospirillales bacterium]|nr:HAMP domain-containing protein [Rhodospirillales bacterium]
MRRLVPDTLAGRTIVILVIGLGLFHLWSIWIYQIGTENLLGSTREQGLAEHLVSAIHALDELPADQREPTAHALSSPDLEVHWSRSSLMSDRTVETERLADLRRRIRQLAPALAEHRLRFGYADDAERHRHLLLASMQLGDGSWVTFSLNAFRQGATVEHDVLGSLTAMAVGIIVVSVLLVRSMTAPLRALADAADRVGTDISAQGAPEAGPREIRQVAKAFNTMRSRIRRLITDRTQTLAAVSHDLKTPLTRLRLRAEFVGDRELRASIDADLDEMERMIDSALAFLRGDETGEEGRTSDIGSILKTICDHLGDTGDDVVLSGDHFAPLHCKPLAIKRALSNLIENAVKYGGRARVSLTDGADEVIVMIEDDGPGIAETERERVFDPFYRIEGSRSRETGGSGLGLTVARTVVRAHGGDITLQTRNCGGLRVLVALPKSAAR